MTSALRKPSYELRAGTESEVHVVLSREERDLLSHLRMVSVECRTSARDDLFKACAMLAANPVESGDAHARALMRCLAQALGKRPKLFRPGVKDVSFDEAWLIRLASAAREGDDASLTFLLHSRVPAIWRRNLAFLIRSVVARFY